MSTANTGYLAFRPLLADFVLSMPRGAQVIYPKDAAQIVGFGDVGPGMRVLEAGAGSGALTCSLLRAVGRRARSRATSGGRTSPTRRGNVGAFFGEVPANWSLRLGDLVEHPAEEVVDRVVLDMLEPWAVLPTVAAALRPGGVLVGYVASNPAVHLRRGAAGPGPVDGAARVGDPAPTVARGRAGRAPGASHGGAHGLPGDGPAAGRRNGGAHSPAAGAEGLSTVAGGLDNSCEP